jgi:hypothetical protein
LSRVCCGRNVIGVRGIECLLVCTCLINGIDLSVNVAQVVGCDLEHLFGVRGMRGELELNRVVLIGSATIAGMTIARVSHAHGSGGCEHDKAEAV